MFGLKLTSVALFLSLAVASFAAPVDLPPVEGNVDWRRAQDWRRGGDYSVDNRDWRRGEDYSVDNRDWRRGEDYTVQYNKDW